MESGSVPVLDPESGLGSDPVSESVLDPESVPESVPELVLVLASVLALVSQYLHHHRYHLPLPSTHSERGTRKPR